MKIWLLGIGCLAVVSLGCCTNPNNCGSAGYGLATTRVPPPGTTTYSAAATPLAPGGTPAGIPAATMSTGVPATIPNNSAVPLLPGADPMRPAGTLPPPGAVPGAQPNGWQPAGTAPTGASYYGAPYSAGQPPTGFAAASTAAAVNGYQTTTSTAAGDSTRMPAVDATGVRAPVGMVQQASGTASPLVIPGSMVYGSTPQVVGAAPTGYPYPTGGYPPQGANSNYVIAQASTKAMDSDPNYQSGWRTAGTPAPTTPR